MSVFFSRVLCGKDKPVSLPPPASPWGSGEEFVEQSIELAKAGEADVLARSPLGRSRQEVGSANLRRVKRALRPILLRLLWWSGRISGDKIERALLQRFNPDRKLFLPPGTSALAFFARLDARDIEYVLLRWSQDLLHLRPTQDLDILVSDRCVPAVFRELSLWPIGRKVDLYSESGISGTTYGARLGNGERRQIPVFPIDRSTHILTHRVRREGRCFVPCPEDQLWSLAYHVAYLKKAASGVALRSVKESPPPGKHDYPATLRELAVAVGVSLDGDITRVRLAELLKRNGWHAPDLLGDDIASQAAT
jgi:hypothetical protein